MWYRYLLAASRMELEEGMKKTNRIDWCSILSDNALPLHDTTELCMLVIEIPLRRGALL